MRLHVIEPAHVAFDPESCLVLCIFDEAQPPFGSTVAASDAKTLQEGVDRKVLSGKSESTYYLSTCDGPYGGVLVLGLGHPDAFDAEVMRRAAGKACAILGDQRHAHIVLDASTGDALPVEAFVEGIMLGQYDFASYKKSGDDAPCTVQEITVVARDDGLEELRAGCGHAVLVCENTNWARDLGNMPPNDMTPTALAAQASDMAKQVGATCTVFDENKLRELNMNAILGVAQGSDEPPCLILLDYAPEDAQRTVALVGKGVTFDTGGISLKPGTDMHEMKFDMCGAAAVLGAFKTICQRKPKVRVICAVPSAENKPGTKAYVPGDILRCYNGKTVEVHNTDAEGRMLLADALAYVDETYRPDAMVDVATLTGACVVALGQYAAGLFPGDDTLAGELQHAAQATGERIWPLPMWEDYAKLIKGTHADLCNIGPRGIAGSITAACFLREFAGSTPWAHLDIAGTAWDVKHISYLNPDHATGFGVRLLSQWVLETAPENT